MNQKFLLYLHTQRTIMPEKTIYIIAGCNGAGKTTASYTVLPEILNCREFVNADEIAKGLSPFNPESVAIEAGRLMLERIALLMDKGVTFAIETTLATRSYRHLVETAQNKGYKVILLFFWLDSPRTAMQRVKRRVSEGGHNIPPDIIERRYWKGLDNLFDIFIPIVDSWAIYDNIGKTLPIASKQEIIDYAKFETIKKSCRERNK